MIHERWHLPPGNQQDHMSKDNNLNLDISFDGRGDVLEMSRYIDLNLYHAVERSHPYYEEMLAEILGQLAKHAQGQPFHCLELGAGTGLASTEILALPELRLDALELDAQCCELLARHTAGRARCIQGDAVTYLGNAPYDAVVSVFAHDHIHYDRGRAFASNIRRNLRPGGLYIMGGEILPRYHDEESRIDALHRYHGFIVAKALREGHFELAQIEINALKSGVFMIGDFKRHEALFEEEMLSAAFRLRDKIKLGPQNPTDVGGVYVYVFEAV